MTEKTILQQINNLAFDIQHTDDLQVAFEKASEILKLTDHDTPLFAVGEYYVDEEANFIFKVLEINDGTIKVLELDTWFYKLKEGAFNLDSTFAKEAKPANAEQIAAFKCAEIKREIGLIIKKGDADWIEIVEDIEEYLAEEMQEVPKDVN